MDTYLPVLAATLSEKRSYSEFFLSIFSPIRTEYGEILLISPYLAQMRENMDQKNSEYGHFSRRVTVNDSLKRGIFPNELKLTEVIPLFRKADPFD